MEINTGSTNTGTTIIVNIEQTDVINQNWLPEWILILDFFIFVLICLVVFIYKLIKI